MFAGRQLSNGKYQMDCLDGLRGTAALIVFLSHTSNHHEYFLPHFNFTGIGKSGVWLFFVLSAFLLTYPFIEKGGEAFRKAFLLNYAMRRFLRIYPLYFCYLLMALVTSLFLPRLLGLDKPFGIPFALTGSGFIQQATFQQGYGVTWSILAEFRYYFVLPLMALIFFLLRQKLLPSLTMMAIVMAASEYFWPQSTATNNDPGLGQYLPIFILGSTLALVHYHWRHRGWHERRWMQVALEALGFASLLVVILLMPSVKAWLTGDRIDPGELHTQYVLYGMLWTFLLFACVNGYGLLRRLFEVKALRYLGFISFSFYLLQDIFIEHLPHVLGRLPFIAWLILLATIAASHLSYILIERPFSRIKYQAAPRQAQAGVPATPP